MPHPLRSKRVARINLCASLLLWSALTASAALAKDVINTGYFGDVAIQGYDPVAYFTKGSAMLGKKKFSHEWLGAKWHFANLEHKKLFVETPHKYAPQYGGHCATGLAIHGKLTKDIDPEAWAIIDGKLYLNYSKETNQLLTDNVIKLDKAEKNWKQAQALE